MKAINLIKKVISCTPDKLSNTQRLTMSGLIFALDFKTFGGQTSRLKISGLSGVSISATHRNMSQFIKLGLVSQQRRTKTIKTAQGDERREIDPYIKINIEALIKYIEHSHSEIEHSHSENTHSHGDIPYTDYNTDYNTDLFTDYNTVDTRTRKRRKQHASAWCDLEKQKEIIQAWSELEKKGVER